MENENEIDPEKMMENLKSAQGFMSDIAQSGEKHGIPPSVAVTVFGLFSRAVVRMHEQDGMSKQDAIKEVVTDFTDGLGIKTLFRLHDTSGKKMH
jgi:hypothetical protein